MWALTILCSALIAAAACDGPSKPIITSETRVFSIIEVNLTAVAYNELVTKKDAADVIIAWNVETGGEENSARVFLNGTVFWTGTSSTNGSANFTVSKGGRYKTIVQVCNTTCNYSDPFVLIIADTDGSHLDPLPYTFEENNVPYVQSSGKVIGSYFMEWGIYARNYTVDKVPIPNLTHMIYAFIPICGGEGINDSLEDSSFEALQAACAGREDFKVAIHDPYAALQASLTGVTGADEPYRGTYGQLMMLKQAKPDMVILPSIGGWSLSDPFYFFNDTTKRELFVSSVKDFLETWKFYDGVDIDWEYPGGNGANANLGDPDVDGNTYLYLMQELREMLDELSTVTGKTYQLTSAIGSAWSKIDKVNYTEVAQYMDHLFLMTYDFYVASAGGEMGNLAAIYAPTWNPSENFTVDFAVNLLLDQDVPAEKIVVGVAMYGRGWTGVTNYTDDIPFTGVSTGVITGTWEAGTVDYRAIPEGLDAGEYVYYYDDVAKAPYVFNSTTGELITYDNK